MIFLKITFFRNFLLQYYCLSGAPNKVFFSRIKFTLCDICLLILHETVPAYCFSYGKYVSRSKICFRRVAETYFASRNNTSRRAKLGDIGQTIWACYQWFLVWQNWKSWGEMHATNVSEKKCSLVLPVLSLD